MEYAYARVSSKGQNLDRQLEAFRELDIPERQIITDKESGKDFNRKGYNQLVGTDITAPLLREGDLLTIYSIDRLGRNYSEIKEQWRRLTQELKVDIRVLDMPLLDTRNRSDSLDSKFVSELVLQILSYVAEKERQNIRVRQRQGIDSALAKGVHFGKEKIQRPDNWDEVYSRWKSNEITAVDAMKDLGLKKNTFYRIVKESCDE